MTPLPCRPCGAVDAPRLAGRRPACGRGAVSPLWDVAEVGKEGEDVGERESLYPRGNGLEVRGRDAHSTSGTACASFTLACAELGQDGREHTTLIPCECWGKKAEASSEIEAGTLVLFEGKLAKRKKGEQWELVVSGFEVTPVLPPVASMTGRST